MVLYLGYDSIERGFSLGDSSFCNNLHDASNGYVFFSDPYILTSSLTPVEKYYNWLLMDDINYIRENVPKEYRKEYLNKVIICNKK